MTVSEAWNKADAREAFRAGANLNLCDATGVGFFTFKDLGNMKWGELIVLLKTGQHEQSNSFNFFSFFKRAASGNESNMYREMLDFTAFIIIDSISANSDNFDFLTDISKDHEWEMSSVLINPVIGATTLAAIASVAEIEDGNIYNTTLEETAVKIGNNVIPKVDSQGKKVPYANTCDVLLTMLETENGIKADMNTNIGKLLSELVTKEGAFVPSDNPNRYPTIFTVTGKTNPNAVFRFNAQTDAENINSNLNDVVFMEFDGKVLTKPQISVTANEGTDTSTISVTGLFNDSGIHILRFYIFNSPYCMIINLDSENEPTTESTTESTEPTTESITEPTKPVVFDCCAFIKFVLRKIYFFITNWFFC